MTAWFPIEQGTRQGCNVSPTEFSLYAEHIMRTVEENYEGVVIGGRRITNVRYADDTTYYLPVHKNQEIFQRFGTTCISQKSKIMDGGQQT